jgi:hypothetical protein
MHICIEALTTTLGVQYPKGSSLLCPSESRDSCNDVLRPAYIPVSPSLRRSLCIEYHMQTDFELSMRNPKTDVESGIPQVRCSSIFEGYVTTRQDVSLADSSLQSVLQVEAGGYGANSDASKTEQDRSASHPSCLREALLCEILETWPEALFPDVFCRFHLFLGWCRGYL